MAGFVAENILLDRLKIFYWNEVDQLNPDDILLDVRTEKEYSEGKIANAINIPVDEIRERMNEIPRDKKIFIYCEAGLRGYLAHRILRQNDFKEVYNLSGGYKTWNACQLEASPATPAINKPMMASA
jgi:rhodanese-related sulfurtransferase